MSSSDEEQHEEAGVGGLPSYYQRPGCQEIQKSIKDLDLKSNFNKFCSDVSNVSSQNFLVDYGDDQAYCAFDLSPASIQKLVDTDRPSNLTTRWINIWFPYKQRDVLNILAKKYQFSARLLGFMCERPLGQAQNTMESENESEYQAPNISQKPAAKSLLNSESVDADVEQCIHEKKLPVQSVQPQIVDALSYYSLMDKVWHWTSLDWGRQYVCIGYNSVYGTEFGESEDFDDNGTRDPGRPRGKRVWTWLLLSTDGTVISITEDPYPRENGDYSVSERKMIQIIRSNLKNAFQHLSKAYDTRKKNPITLLPLRKRPESSHDENIHEPEAAPSLLFWSLFDDWAATYSLIARKEYQYSGALDRMRMRMLESADLGHADQFHNLGRRLSTLKRLYEGYELLIERLLDQQKQIVVALADSSSRNDEHTLRRAETSFSKIPNAEMPLGAKLTPATRVRFERLKDRIRLYALSEIQDCLDQKESLVKMNFNLIAIKESYSIERFTRAALILTKITILFLPVTVMSSYFSADLVDTQFTVHAFWTAFGIVLGSSLILIFAFGAYSGTMEGKIIHKPLSKKVLDISRTFVKSRRK